MAEFNTVDVKNAARLLCDYCKAHPNCKSCLFIHRAYGLDFCELNDGSPRNWDIDKEATHD